MTETPKYVVFEIPNYPFVSFVATVEKVNRDSNGRITDIDVSKIISMTLDSSGTGTGLEIGFKNVGYAPGHMVSQGQIITLNFNNVISYSFDLPEKVIESYRKMISEIVIPDSDTTKNLLLLENSKAN